MRASTIGLAVLALASTAAGCGDDEAPAPRPRTTGAKPATTANGARGGSAAGVVAYRRVEDLAGSPQERDAIRHKFNERDFTPDITGTVNRDPFRSFVVAQPGVGLGSGPPPEATDLCPRKRQWARSYSTHELDLVGIVSRGTIRYALFSDPHSYGYVVHVGDCVGKEKARVKEIGASFVTLETSQDQAPNQPPRPAEVRSIQLHPKDLPIGDETDEDSDDDHDTPADLRRRSDELLRGGGHTGAPSAPGDTPEQGPPERDGPPGHQ
ncbi:MAG TPA: pilus assembly protein PilP [Kofleriaceae bacterium]|nr:pilus assembly protein PilP [Kofleriaceae bacterium]